MPTPRRLEYMPARDLAPAKRNPKGHDLAGIKASMERFGYLEPVIMDERTSRLLSGHGRVETLSAAEQVEGVEPPEGVVVKSGVWHVPVIRGWRSSNDEEARAALLAVNRLVERGGWDQPDLAAMLEELRDGSGLVGTGYDVPDLDAMLASLAEPKPKVQDDPDHAPELPAKPRTKRGDLWLLGRHRLICGDSTLPATIAALCPDGADTILTDPPYCSGGFQESKRSGGSIGSNPRVKRRVANDTLSTRGYLALMRAVLSACGDVPILYVFTDWRMWVNLFDVAESSGYGVRQMIVWDKGTPGMGAGWRAQHELIMFGVKAQVKFDNHKAQGNVVAAQRTGNPLHPTQKPVELLAKILAVTDMAQRVLDPFAGSGSTLIACETVGRTAHLVEMDPAHCDVVCRRFEEATGTTPVLERTGKAQSFA